LTKVAVMQPYFFPYLGYFSLIKNTDRFIILDTVQHIKGGWINRNRILRETGGWLYCTVPIKKHPLSATIEDVKIDYKSDWRGKIISQIQFYRKIAPFYFDIKSLLERTLYDDDTDSIVELNARSLQYTCEYIGFTPRLETLSKMQLEFRRPEASDEWPLRICQAIGNVTEYRNLPGGKSFYDVKKYEQSGIHFAFHSAELPVYDQRRSAFENGLSIIDVLMFNSPKDVMDMLNDFSSS
jgi:hypothetical protein